MFMACHLDSEPHYVACMVLSGAGDALGYKNQEWEYCKSGPQIHDELQALGGLDKICVKRPDWPVSDDTVMHLATAEGLTNVPSYPDTVVLRSIAAAYKACMSDMEGRKPGPTSIKGTGQLQPDSAEGYRIPFNPTGTGCGAAMRSMCVGLRFPREAEEEDLIKFSVEVGRMTHHHPTGYLGSLASALFTAYAIRGKPLVSWGRDLVELLPRAFGYVDAVGVAAEENEEAWGYFGDKWNKYLSERGIQDGRSDPVFPKEYGPAERDGVYETFSLDGWAGRSGHDAPMIAYDALLGAGNSWQELCSRSMFHGGDSDSTGVIAAACFGAMYGLEGVPTGNYSCLEYRERLEEQAHLLYFLSHLHSE